uniref:protein LEAD-SENSITIVE 1-like isoform X2 n=1 Tax=Erigeron canadensis TaxID=72917 RepID=UPI001CB944D3|nr:protein LEAD-SENSITIVE 1-like isoform X2 [Erigeron canadensis]
MEDLLSQKVEVSDLNKGDHVYTWRKCGFYSHHGIFIGDGKIIHFVQTNKSAILASSSESSDHSGEYTPCLDESYCRSETVPGSGVRITCIACFVKNKKRFLYRYKYNASSKFLIAKVRAGTCTTASSDPQETVMHRVNYLYKNGYGEYHLKNNNCEDFALYCKTGLWSNDKDRQGRSSQANMVDGYLELVEELMQGGPIDHASLIPRLAMVVPKSFAKREKNDLGNRRDVVKVDVKELSSFISSLN